jgi:CBS domain-containing protein
MRDHQMTRKPASQTSPWQSLASPVPPSSSRRAADLASARFVKLPSWFTVGSARRVMQAKGVRHALVEQGGRLIGSVDARTLAQAPEPQVLAQRMVPSSATVSADATEDQALAILASEAADCLPVVAGVILVGVVTRDDLEAASTRGQAGGDAEADQRPQAA